MKLYIKQKVFSWKEKFDIYGEDGTPVFYVEGKFFSLGHQFTIYDIQGTPLAEIKEKPFALLNEFHISVNSESVILKKQLTFFKPRYSLLGTQWTLAGDIWAYNYAVESPSDGPIMTLRKHWFTFGDSYELDIPNPRDAILALCIALSIDADLCNSGS